jgi:hypothetical protein
MVLEEKIAKRMKKTALKKAWRVKHLARDDMIDLANDLEQEGWLAWLLSEHKDEERRWADVAGRMSDYWRRWRWEKHYRLPIPSRPGMDFEALENYVRIESPLLTDDKPSVEDNVLGCEIMYYLENKFKEKRYPQRYERSLFECIVYGI